MEYIVRAFSSTVEDNYEHGQGDNYLGEWQEDYSVEAETAEEAIREALKAMGYDSNNLEGA